MRERPTEWQMLWLLGWSIALVVAYIIFYNVTTDRAIEAKHSAVMESMIPPSTLTVKTF